MCEQFLSLQLFVQDGFVPLLGKTHEMYPLEGDLIHFSLFLELGLEFSK